MIHYYVNNNKNQILFFACKPWGKLGVPEANIEGHGDQFKYCILLSTWERDGLYKSMFRSKYPIRYSIKEISFL